MKLRVIARIKKVLGTFLVLSLLFVTGFSFPREARAVTCGFGSEIAGGLCQGFLTSNPGSGDQSWTVPGDWNNSNNSVACIGSGGTGADGVTDTASGAGGGGGAYASTTNLTLSGSVTYRIGASATTTSAANGPAGARVTFFDGTSSSTASLTCDWGKMANGTTAGTAGNTAN